MTDNILKSQSFKVKGRLYTFTVLQLISTDKEAFILQLNDLIEKAPKLFNQAPVVLDCSLLLDQDIDFSGFCEALRAHHLLLVGVQKGSESINTLAQYHGLAIVNASSAHDKMFVIESPSEETTNLTLAKSKLLPHPVRSGQQVVSKEGDLIVTASVSHGAELLAEGNIHVYGALRGRALAGISGDRKARIFCYSLDAELVSIAGFYRLSDAITPINTPCQIYLEDEHIRIEPLC